MIPQGMEETFGFSSLVYVSRAPPPHAGSLGAPDRFQPGGNVLMLNPAALGGQAVNLTNLEEGDVLGIDVAPDGSFLAASIRTSQNDRYHIYKIDVEKASAGSPCFEEDGDVGPACARLTFGPANDTRPFHLPDGRVAFLREDPEGPVDILGRGRARLLFAMDPDGSFPTKLDMGPGHVFGAGPLRNGWLQLVRWTEREGRQVFMSFRSDPTGVSDLRPDGPRDGLQTIPLDPVQNSNGDLFAACVAPQGTWGAGTICQRNDEGGFGGIFSSIPYGRGCSPEGRLRDPYPLPDGRFLASYAKLPGGCLNAQDGDRGLIPDFSIAILDQPEDRWLPVYNHPKTADLLPRPVVQRVLLDPGTKLPDRPGGCEKGGIVFQGWVGAEMFSKGATRIRVLEGVSGALAPWMIEIGPGPVGSICGGDTDGDTRVDAWEAPVFEDGSFSLRAPAEVPLRIQVLDHYGAALASDPIWRGGPPCTTRSCSGCHENQGGTAGFDRSLAAGQQVFDLQAPSPDQRSFDFRRDIQPILDRSCSTTGCHDTTTSAGAYMTLNGGLQGLNLGGSPSGRTTTSYQNLLFLDQRRDSTTGEVELERWSYVVPWRARESLLARKLGVPCRFDCGGQPAWAPWGLGAGSTHPEDQPGWNGRFTSEERWQLLEWIDAGAPFHGRGAVP